MRRTCPIGGNKRLASDAPNPERTPPSFPQGARRHRQPGGRLPSKGQRGQGGCRRCRCQVAGPGPGARPLVQGSTRGALHSAHCPDSFSKGFDLILEGASASRPALLFNFAPPDLAPHLRRPVRECLRAVPRRSWPPSGPMASPPMFRCAMAANFPCSWRVWARIRALVVRPFFQVVGSHSVPLAGGHHRQLGCQASQQPAPSRHHGGRHSQAHGP